MAASGERPAGVLEARHPATARLKSSPYMCLCRSCPRQINHPRKRAALGEFDDNVKILLLAFEVCSIFHVPQLTLVSQSCIQASLGRLQQTQRSVDYFDDLEATVLKDVLVDTWWNKLGESAIGPQTECIRGNGSSNDRGVSEQKSSTGNQNSLDLTKYCEAVGEMKNDIEAKDCIERGVEVGQWLI